MLFLYLHLYNLSFHSLKKLSCMSRYREYHTTQKKVGKKKAEKLEKVRSFIFLFKTCDTFNLRFVKLHSVRDSYQFWKHPTDFKHSDRVQVRVYTLIKRIELQVSFMRSPSQPGNQFWWKQFISDQLGGQCEFWGSNTIWNINQKLSCPHQTQDAKYNNAFARITAPELCF